MGRASARCPLSGRDINRAATRPKGVIVPTTHQAASPTNKPQLRGRRTLGTIVGMAAVAAAVTVGCSSAKPAAASPYCDAARRWAIHELTPVGEDAPPPVARK